MNLRRLSFALLICVVSSVNVSAQVDSGLLDLVMPDATILAGVQVPAMLASPLGKAAFAQLRSTEGAPGQPGRVLEEFSNATGFDLQRDLNEILIASSGPLSSASPNLVLLRGTFDPSKFISFAGQAGLTSSTIAGVSVVQLDPATSIAFLDSTAAAIAVPGMLTKILERRAAGARSSGLLGQRAQSASATGQLWFATATPLSQLVDASASPISIPLLDTIREFSTTARLAAEGMALTCEFQTRSEQEAQSLGAALKLMTALYRTPQTEFLQTAQFSVEGPLARVTLTIPEAQVEQWLAPSKTTRPIAQTQ